MHFEFQISNQHDVHGPNVVFLEIEPHGSGSSCFVIQMCVVDV